MEAPAVATTGASYEPIIWLSGEVTTPLNKLVFPLLWLALITQLPFHLLVETWHTAMANDFRLLGALILIATVWMLWFSMRLHRVGYAGRELVVSNYLREARIPFEQVISVGSVWWYRRRLVRVELRSDAPIGPVIYYMPRWAMFRALWRAPEKDLRDLISQR